MSDLIKRADAIEVIAQQWLCEASAESPYVNDDDIEDYRKLAEKLFEDIPTADAVSRVDVTNESENLDEKKVSDDAVQGWIPVSERLPKAENMYQPPEQRYLCQLEAYGERKFCVLSRLKGAVSPFWDWYGVAVHDSEVTAWMPLPTPYKGGDSE